MSKCSYCRFYDECINSDVELKWEEFRQMCILKEELKKVKELNKNTQK